LRSCVVRLEADGLPDDVRGRSVRTTHIDLDADLASNLGIAMNKLLINAAKYAAPSDGRALVEISLDCDGNKMLRLADREGLPESQNIFPGAQASARNCAPL
jgi:two-component sensor histidine kinase